LSSIKESKLQYLSNLIRLDMISSKSMTKEGLINLKNMKLDTLI